MQAMFQGQELGLSLGPGLGLGPCLGPGLGPCLGPGLGLGLKLALPMNLVQVTFQKTLHLSTVSIMHTHTKWIFITSVLYFLIDRFYNSPFP